MYQSSYTLDYNINNVKINIFSNNIYWKFIIIASLNAIRDTNFFIKV